jgi:hypothetical protein
MGWTVRLNSGQMLRCDVLTATKMSMLVFCVVMRCSLVGGHQSLCLQLTRHVEMFSSPPLCPGQYLRLHTETGWDIVFTFSVESNTFAPTRRLVEIFSSSPLCPQQYLRPHLAFLSSVYRKLFPWRQSGRSVNLITHLHFKTEVEQYPCTHIFKARCLIYAQGRLYNLVSLPILVQRKTKRVFLTKAA